MKILLTGSNGFIGTQLAKELLSRQESVSAIVRDRKNINSVIEQFVIGDFSKNPDFSKALVGVDCIVHLAAKAHVIDSKKKSALDEFKKINTEFTLNLAKQAIKENIKRFIFMSSIGVNGNANNQSFLETDNPNPQEPYAFSKNEAEQGLLQLAKNSNMEIVIIRPPLVYGENAPGNFGKLLNWASKKYPIPLPLGLVNNSRSLVAIDNLVDFIVLCIKHPKAKNEVFLISDDENVSTTQLLQKICQAFNKKALLLPVPISWMICIASMFGKKPDSVRLFSSLTVDISKAKRLLDWTPVTTMNEQLVKIADNYDKNS